MWYRVFDTKDKKSPLIRDPVLDRDGYSEVVTPEEKEWESSEISKIINDIQTCEPMRESETEYSKKDNMGKVGQEAEASMEFKMLNEVDADKHLTPREILEKNGYVKIPNPADKEIDDIELKRLINELKMADGLVGMGIDTGYSISEEIAFAILRVYAPEKVDVKCDSYTIIDVGNKSLLIGRDEEMVCKFYVDLPRDMDYRMESSHLEEAIAEARERAELYKKISRAGGIIFWSMAILTVIIYTLAFYVGNSLR